MHRKLQITTIIVLFPLIIFAGWKDHMPLPINADQNPGDVNPHYNSGGRRLVRINNTILALAPEQSGEKIYRSSDNGESWEEISSNATYSGCLISGKNQMVYYFFRNGNDIEMITFKYNEAPPEPVVIYSDPAVARSETGAYKAINAIVDSSGFIYVACHWGEPDDLYILSSQDEGQTWSDPLQISSGDGPWYYPHLEVSQNNILFCIYEKWQVHEMVCARSADQGLTWNSSEISTELTYNPSLLIKGVDLYVFAQSGEDEHRGLVFNRSTDQGESWTDWQLIDPTCGYADPSPGLGTDGTMYVAFRSSNGSGLTGGSCGDQSKSRLAMSSDDGATWTFPDDYYEAEERVGTRNQIRYQTWFNYGGPLEWIWMQYESNGSQRPIYYDINTDITINEYTSANTKPKRADIDKGINIYKNSPSDQNEENVLEKIKKYLQN